MELKAVIKSLEFIQNTWENVSEVEVYTDSEYVKGLLSRRARLADNNYHTVKGKEIRNKALVIQLYEWLEKYDLTMVVIKGHAKKGRSKITDYHRDVDKISRKLVRQKSKGS